MHHGCHFGRTVYALCNFQALLTNGLLQMGKLADIPEENFTVEYHFFSHWQAMVLTKGSFRERWEHCVFEELLRSVPGLEECLLHGSEEEVSVLKSGPVLGSIFDRTRTGPLRTGPGPDQSTFKTGPRLIQDQAGLVKYIHIHMYCILNRVYIYCYQHRHHSRLINQCSNTFNPVISAVVNLAYIWYLIYEFKYVQTLSMNASRLVVQAVWFVWTLFEKCLDFSACMRCCLNIACCSVQTCYTFFSMCLNSLSL